jgi:hypothetical protein
MSGLCAAKVLCRFHLVQVPDEQVEVFVETGLRLGVEGDGGGQQLGHFPKTLWHKSLSNSMLPAGIAQSILGETNAPSER